RIGRRRILRGRLRRPRVLRRRFVYRSTPSMVRRAPTTKPAVAPVIAPELRPRRPRSETKRERNGDAYANGWHGRTLIPTRRGFGCRASHRMRTFLLSTWLGSFHVTRAGTGFCGAHPTFASKTVPSDEDVMELRRRVWPQ